VAHGEHAEQEAAIELVGLLLELQPQVVDVPVDLGQRLAVSMPGEPLAERLELGEKRSASAANSSRPGNAEAKMIAVSSRRSLGSCQRSGSCVPVVVVL
jgi:hypothetical protein